MWSQHCQIFATAKFGEKQMAKFRTKKDFFGYF